MDGERSDRPIAGLAAAQIGVTVTIAHPGRTPRSTGADSGTMSLEESIHAPQ